MQRLGLKRWIDGQLHPEKVPENPVLEEKLRPFVSTRMGIRERIAIPVAAADCASGTRQQVLLPDDPELRAIVMRLAERYRLKDATRRPTAANDPNDDSISTRPSASTAILTSQQIES